MVTVLDSTHFTLMDWKNKEGKTLQLSIYPSSATVGDMNFEWRLSSAFMQANNKFSSFPAYNRVLLQTEGFEYPMKLNIHDKDTIQLQPFVPVLFDGNDVVDCEVGGFVKDFNVMTKKGQWKSDVSTASNYSFGNKNNNDNINKNTTNNTFEVQGDISFLYCVSGKVRLCIAVDENRMEYSLNANEMIKFENNRRNAKFDVLLGERDSAVVFVDLIKE